MATNVHTISTQELDLLSFLRQNIVRKLEIEAARQGLPKTHPWVCQAVIRHFNLGPAPNQNFDHMVWHITHDQ